MNYEEALKGFDQLNLKEKFIEEFEPYCSKGLLKLIKKSENINSTGSLVRGLLKKYEVNSPEWNYWREIFFYFLTPKSMRVTPNINL